MFKRQNYFRLKRLGLKWRRPKGRQSKMRKSKKGHAKRPSIGYSKGRKAASVSVVRNVDELKGIKAKEITISASVGLKKFAAILEEAKKLGIIVKNRKRKKKIRQAAGAAGKKAEKV